jgi:hypothetical protein
VEIGRFSRPVHVTSPANDLRLFVVEQQTGLVKIVDAAGTILPTPFLDLHAGGRPEPRRADRADADRD